MVCWCQRSCDVDNFRVFLFPMNFMAFVVCLFAFWSINAYVLRFRWRFFPHSIQLLIFSVDIFPPKKVQCAVNDLIANKPYALRITFHPSSSFGHHNENFLIFPPMTFAFTKLINFHSKTFISFWSGRMNTRFQSSSVSQFPEIILIEIFWWQHRRHTSKAKNGWALSFHRTSTSLKRHSH